MKKRFILYVVLLAMALSVFGGCSSGSEETKLQVTFGEAGWDSMKFHNAVAMYISEVAYDIEVKEVSGTTAVTYGALLSGDIQVFMEIWTENLATYDDDIATGKIRELSINYGDNKQGLYVPRYVIEGDEKRGIEAAAPELKTVEDLKNYSDVFTDPEDTSKGRIYGAISGWEADKVLRSKYTYYGLDESYNYMDPGSDAALSAAISAAYERGEPIVAYYWEPAWLTGKYDLVLLEDAPYDESLYRDGKCAYPSVSVTVCVNSDFYETAPELCEFLSNYKTSSALTSEALSHMQDTGATSEEMVIWFLTTYDELLDQWLPEDKAGLVRESLAS